MNLRRASGISGAGIDFSMTVRPDVNLQFAFTRS